MCSVALRVPAYGQCRVKADYNAGEGRRTAQHLTPLITPLPMAHLTKGVRGW